MARMGQTHETPTRQKIETSKQECPQAVVELVARFAEHREAYQRQTYNETQARREFIDPFFSALGWDVDNRSGAAEAYKDVIHEDAIKVGRCSLVRPIPSIIMDTYLFGA